MALVAGNSIPKTTTLAGLLEVTLPTTLAGLLGVTLCTTLAALLGVTLRTYDPCCSVRGNSPYIHMCVYFVRLLLFIFCFVTCK